MASRPVVSIVTVVYNGEEGIEPTIRSVLEQDYGLINYVVIDGDSRDGTLSIIRRYAGRIDYWASEPDDGIYHAMNKGIEAASGDLVLFLNAGDTLYGPDVLSDFVDRYYSGKDQVIYLFSVRTDRGRLIAPNVRSLVRHYKLPVYHQGIVYPLAVLKNKLYDLRYRLVADFHHYHQLSVGMKYEVVPMVLSRFDTSGVSSVQRPALNKEFVLAYKDLGISRGYVFFRWLKMLLGR